MKINWFVDTKQADIVKKGHSIQTLPLPDAGLDVINYIILL